MRKYLKYFWLIPIIPMVVICVARSQTPVASAVPEAEDTGWRISPEKLSIEQGADRVLQVLDDSSQELTGVEWSVNDPALVEAHEEDGRLIVRAIKPGTVIVSALLHGEQRTRQISIASAGARQPGTVNWGTHPIGRELGDIAAVPTGDGPNILTLEQTRGGETYLRGIRDDGIQIWAWHLPEKAVSVDLVCGNWLGGALISANHGNDYTVYNIGNDGKTIWKYTLAGSRKSHTITPDNVVNLLSQTADGTVTKLTAFQPDGQIKYDLAIPASHQRTNVSKSPQGFRCMPGYVTSPTRTIASKLFVSEVGFEYLAFTENDWTTEAKGCAPGSAVETAKVTFARSDRVVLWQIQEDGQYRRTIVEEATTSDPVTNAVSVPSPTGGLITDGMSGALVSIRKPLNAPGEKTHAPAAEYVYRIDPEGKVLYRLLLPSYDGDSHDEMVLGENNVGFTTRGSKLVAFDVNSGAELWRWDSGVPGIEVFAALADGGCLVQTPKALINVHNANQAQQMFEGHAMIGWNGQIYRKGS